MPPWLHDHVLRMMFFPTVMMAITQRQIVRCIMVADGTIRLRGLSVRPEETTVAFHQLWLQSEVRRLGVTVKSALLSRDHDWLRLSKTGNEPSLIGDTTDGVQQRPTACNHASRYKICDH